MSSAFVQPPVADFCGTGQPPWKDIGRLAAPTASNISVRGTAVLLEPLPAHELRLPRSWINELELPKAAGHFAAGTAWRYAASAVSSGRRLVLAVLGASVTAGCGSSEPWNVYAPNGSSLHRSGLIRSGPWRLCALERSWGRRFHDELQAVLVPRGLWFGGDAVATTINTKNAVDASYFSHCTGGFVPADAHIVLVEVANNLFGTSAASAANLRQLLVAIRAVAPNAAVTFVNWAKRAVTAIEQAALGPSRSMDARVHASSRRPLRHGMCREMCMLSRLLACLRTHAPIEQVASSDAADVVRAGEVLARLRVQKLTYSRSSSALYAALGADKVHAGCIPMQPRLPPHAPRLQPFTHPDYHSPTTKAVVQGTQAATPRMQLHALCSGAPLCHGARLARRARGAARGAATLRRGLRSRWPAAGGGRSTHAVAPGGRRRLRGPGTHRPPISLLRLAVALTRRGAARALLHERGPTAAARRGGRPPTRRKRLVPHRRGRS